MPSPLSLEFKLGGMAEGAPPSPSPPMPVVCPPLPSTSQLRTVSSSPFAPSRGPHVPAGARLTGSPRVAVLAGLFLR